MRLSRLMFLSSLGIVGTLSCVAAGKEESENFTPAQKTGIVKDSRAQYASADSNPIPSSPTEEGKLSVPVDVQALSKHLEALKISDKGGSKRPPSDDDEAQEDSDFSSKREKK